MPTPTEPRPQGAVNPSLADGPNRHAPPSLLDTLKHHVTRRRALLITPVAFAGLVAVTSKKSKTASAETADVTIIRFTDAGQNLGPARLQRIVKSDAEWRKLLSTEQFYVTRRENTDTPFSGTYYKLHQPGLYRCICCGSALFTSETKFDSGTGWPSFWDVIAPENVTRRHDRELMMEVTEVHCTLCGAHLGHVFDDGPAPTNLRYCIDESSLRFVAKA